ncbi:MAG: hypothetical protein EOP42_31410 [Sphingobacteriaceae bacterium]|nr:MAG: hypothetical protein EOP42_31410 [Sphingobacteriaceae bacterium]
MIAAKYRLLSSVLFITVLLVKLFIAVSPVFFELKNQAVVQFEKDTKSDKEDSDKDGSKDKKSFDEDFVYCLQHLSVASITCINAKLCFKQPLYYPDHCITVHTPPPDSRLA